MRESTNGRRAGEESPGGALSGPDLRPRLSTEDLFRAGRSEVCIDHNGMTYILRITRQNKLILNK